MAQSISLKCVMLALYISSADLTCIQSIACGIASVVGPIIKVTMAPRLCSSLAMAIPIFPEEAFPINRTGSMASCVGPAVTKIFLPDSSADVEK